MCAASQNTVPLNLSNKIDIVRSLSRVISSSFGPFCLHTMLTTSTGAVLSTSQGVVIMKCLQTSHPLARVVVEAAVSHHVAVGDGMKTLLLFLEHALQAAEDIIDNHTSSYRSSTADKQQTNNYFCNRISIALGKFSNTVLSELFTEVEQKADILNADCCKNILKDRMFSVVLTTISTHFSSSVSHFFASLLMDCLFLETGLQDLESAKQRVNFVLDNFQFLHVKSPGQSYKESSTVGAILLQKDFLLLSDRLSKGDVKCVLLNCPIEGAVSDDNTTLRLKSNDTLHDAFALNKKNAKRFLHSLKSHKVTLIISTEKIPDYVISLCRMFNISVIGYVDKDDIEVLENLSGKFVIHNTWDVVDESVVIGVSECRRLEVGGRVCVQLHLEKDLPRSLVLCAPTDGMCHQLADIMYKALKSLSACFQKTAVSHGDVIIKDLTLCSIHASTLDVHNNSTPDVRNTSIHYVHNASTCNDHKTSTCDVNTSTCDVHNASTCNVNASTPDVHNTSTPDVHNASTLDVHNTSTHDIHNASTHDIHNVSTPDVNASTPDVHNTSTPDVHNASTPDVHNTSTPDVHNSHTTSHDILLNNSNTVKTHNQVKCTQDHLKFVTIPGSGYFEYMLAELLQQKMKMCDNQEIIWCCKIMTKALRSVPFALHKNLFPNADARSFLLKDAEMCCAVRNDRVAGFDNRGCVCDPVRAGIMEPLSAKMAVVMTVIQLVIQLLKIDSIVSVNSLNN